MKTYNEKVTVNIPEELGEQIECFATYYWENDGIGSYEFWGFSGYDKGNTYMVIDNITPIFTDQPEDVRLSINKFVDEHYDSIGEDIALQIEKIYEDMKNDI
jgi:hypothetical protein